ncbi:DUF4421 domain-containing protein [Flagellimonas olearia]|uniref:DUF4421 domain-containing protein n=1 Tax=Flagellimonas olearia TaxID=552546 RepID=A0A6I1DZ30_9FLAO|nr:DUF4421 family protein [Allomuricauda olearia]KAB7530896.1 DUF4421 domain-containing protein [Allomuricauda olearia]
MSRYRLNSPLHFSLFGIFFFCLFFSCWQVHSQQDTSRIVTYTDKIILKANIDTRTDVLLYRNQNEDERLELTPNSRYRLFLSLDYEFVGVSVGLVPKFMGGNVDENLKGESSFTDYQFRFFLGKWVQGLTYNKTSGYYVRNTADFAPDWIEGTHPYIQFNSLTNSQYGMSTSYVLNPNFSYRNIVYQNEWQKVSSGSLIPTLYYDYNTFTFDELDIRSKERFFNFRLSPRYFYTLVLHENWFISGNVSPSLGVRFSKDVSTENGITEIERNTYFIRSVSSGINLGYSSEKVIFGMNLTLNSDWYNEDSNSSVKTDQFYGVLYLGYRFEPPRFVKKLFRPFTTN